MIEKDRVLVFTFLFYILGLAEYRGDSNILEKNTPHSITLAWKIPWTEEPGGLQSMESLGVRHN